VAEVQEALSILKSNKKIESATHNISAYRISGGPHNTCLQDCNDDGENHAGSRLLHLLQILEVKDVLVVVSRWYGGIQLGPDRFKHINNAARDLLQKCGYIESHDDSNDANHSNQSVKNKKKFK
jgi:putative IMPACT (imprinted ancient) family translation regulator